MRQPDWGHLSDGVWKHGGLGFRLGIGLLVVGQSMIFGLALNLHDDVPTDVRWATQTLILASTLVVAALLGGPLARAAGRELRRGRLTIEALFLLTMMGAMAASVQAHFTGRGHIYFEVISVLLVVYTLGKVIGARTRAVAVAGSRAWAGQLSTCRVLDKHGRSRVISATEIQPGDVIEVHPGETLAADGVIRDGVGFMSEAVVTGEPFGVVRRPGDRVLAGSASHDATFRIEATVGGSERQIDRLLAAVEEAQARPTSLQGQADRIGRVFFPLVVITAVGTLCYWSLFSSGGWEVGLFHAMSVLLVACPCVIGLATPIVIWSAVGRLAEQGVIVRAGDAVERLAGVDRVVFDKTGTLTDEQFALVDVVTAADGDERTMVLGWVSLVESWSRHPVARPFARLPRPFESGHEPRVIDLTAIPGCGVESVIEEAAGDRHRLRIGRPEWVAGGLTAEPWPSFAGKLLTRTGHRVDVSVDGCLAAVAIVAERVRDSVPEMLADFRRMGLPVEILTGDTSERAAALNLPSTRAGLLPGDKQAHILALTAAGGTPLMVGDGINDAAALAVAHVGVALASGTDLAVGASAVTLYHGDLRVLPWAVALSREAVRVVHWSLYRALTYNLIGMALAAGGVLHPVVATLLMVVSSLTLIFSATRVGVWRGHCLGAESADSQPAVETGSVVEAMPTGNNQIGVRQMEDDHPSGTGRAATEGGPYEPTLCRGRPPWRPGVGKSQTWVTFFLPIALSVSNKSMVHATAMLLQGVIVLVLLEPAREPWVATCVLGGFGLVAAAVARGWSRWATIPHTLDMVVGMLTLGNLGMLLGWWADNGFTPLHDGGCEACVEAVQSGTGAPWMWVGMLLFGNAAMVRLGRRPLPRGTDHVLAMWTGGNLGMVGGMIAGGWCAAQVATDSVSVAATLGFAGMTVGMVSGMLVGTRLTEWFISAVRVAIRFPWWIARAEAVPSTRRPEEVIR